MAVLWNTMQQFNKIRI